MTKSLYLPQNRIASSPRIFTTNLHAHRHRHGLLHSQCRAHHDPLHPSPSPLFFLWQQRRRQRGSPRQGVATRSSILYHGGSLSGSANSIASSSSNTRTSSAPCATSSSSSAPLPHQRSSQRRALHVAAEATTTHHVSSDNGSDNGASSSNSSTSSFSSPASSSSEVAPLLPSQPQPSFFKSLLRFASPTPSYSLAHSHLPPSQQHNTTFLLCILFITTCISVCSSVSVAPALGRVIDVISTPITATDTATATTHYQLAIAVSILGAVYLISNVSLAIQVALASATSEQIANQLRNRVFRSLLLRPGVAASYTGAMTSWLGQDVEVLQTTIAKLLGARGLRSVLETVGIICVLAWLSWPLALALLLAAPLVTPVVAAATKSIRGASQSAQAATADASAVADEIVENIKIIRAFSGEPRQLKRYQTRIQRAHELSLKVIALQAVLDVSGRIRNTLCVLVTLSLGAHLALAGRVTIGVCYSFFVYSFSFAFALSNVTATLGDLSKAAGTMARTFSVLEATAADDGVVGEGGGFGDGDDMHLTRSAKRTIDNLQGSIEFRNVSFHHRPNPADGTSGAWSLTDISFVIPPNKTIALVGPSGGGKSTIAALLLGLYTPSSGDILIDGIPLQTLDLTWWRRHVGVVEQAPGLLQGRLYDVVRYGDPEASDQRVQEALEQAQAASFAAALPQQGATLLGPGGIELSGGQRQRLALARALLPNPKVLILDEATSALDVATETTVAQALMQRKNTTSLVIAHRLSTVKRADGIVVVADGKVVEVGGPGGGPVFQKMISRHTSSRRDDGVEAAVEEEGVISGDDGLDFIVDSEQEDSSENVVFTK